jgi:hypothetical protein
MDNPSRSTSLHPPLDSAALVLLELKAMEVLMTLLHLTTSSRMLRQLVR